MFGKDRDDGIIILALFIFSSLFMWLGFSMASGGVCKTRATLPLFAEQLFITFMGER
jgi:hypothetical protein